MAMATEKSSSTSSVLRGGAGSLSPAHPPPPQSVAGPLRLPVGLGVGLGAGVLADGAGVAAAPVAVVSAAGLSVALAGGRRCRGRRRGGLLLADLGLVAQVGDDPARVGQTAGGDLAP